MSKVKAITMAGLPEAELPPDRFSRIHAFRSISREGAAPNRTPLNLTIFLHLTVAMLTITAVNIAQTVRFYPNNIMRRVIADAFFVMFTAGIVGSMIGYMVRDGWGFKHHVDTKSTVDFRSVGLVMITSRFVVLWDRDHGPR